MSKKKRILVWETLSTVSGGQKMTLTIMDMLSNEYEFFCLIPEKGMLAEELKKRKIKYALMGNQSMPTGVKGKRVIIRYGWLSVKNIIMSLKAIKKFKPDYLYAPGPAALPWSAVCGVITKKPVVWHLHHMFLDGPTKKLLNICGAWKSVESIVAVSNCVGNQITNYKAENKIKVIYNPVDVEKYSKGNSNAIFEELESGLGRKIVKNQTIILTHIGAVTKNKCQDFFLQVVFELKKMGMDIIGLLIGDAITETDKKYKNQLINYIQDNNLQRDIFMPGFRKDIPDVLSASDCVIIPSSEGLPLAAMEAMSAKVRIVSIDSNGAYELLNAAGCGEFYPTGGLAIDAAKAVCRVITEQGDKELQKGYMFCEELSEDKYSDLIHLVFE